MARPRDPRRLPLAAEGPPRDVAALAPPPALPEAARVWVVVEATAGAGAAPFAVALAGALAAVGLAARAVGPGGEALAGDERAGLVVLALAPGQAPPEAPERVILVGALGAPTAWSPAARALRRDAELVLGAAASPRPGLVARLARALAGGAAPGG